MNHVSMIIAERGSDWAGWTDRFRGPSVRNVIMVQQLDETLTQFVTRVRTRLNSLTDSGAEITRAAIVGAGRTDGEAVSCRGTIIRALAASMRRSGAGEVILDGSGDRYAMMAIATTVAPLIRGTGVSIHHAEGASDTRLLVA